MISQPSCSPFRLRHLDPDAAVEDGGEDDASESDGAHLVVSAPASMVIPLFPSEAVRGGLHSADGSNLF